MEYSVEIARLAGLSPMESLQVVTRNAARLCGLDATSARSRSARRPTSSSWTATPSTTSGISRALWRFFRNGERVR